MSDSFLRVQFPGVKRMRARIQLLQGMSSFAVLNLYFSLGHCISPLRLSLCSVQPSVPLAVSHTSLFRWFGLTVALVSCIPPRVVFSSLATILPFLSLFSKDNSTLSSSIQAILLCSLTFFVNDN